MYAVFCGVHILVLVGVMVLFILCVRKTTSPAKISFMLVTFSLFILILGMYLELVSSNTTAEAIMALKMQYIGMYPFSLSLLYFTSCMGGFCVPKWLWTIMAVLDAASCTAIVSTGTTEETDHHLFYSSMEMESDGIYSRIVVGKGPFWYITYAVILFIIVYIIVKLHLSMRKSGNAIQIRRIRLILAGVTALGAEQLMKWG